MSILVALILAGSPASAEPVKLASPGLTGVNLKPEVTAFYSDDFAQQLTLNGLRVVTASEIGSLLGFERQRQLLSCSESGTSCIAELANALGVDGIITGSVGKFEDTYQLNVKILSARTGRTMAAFSANVVGDKTLLHQLALAASRLAPQLAESLGRPLVKPEGVAVVADAEPKASSSSGHGLAWVSTAVGVAGLGVGAGLLVHAKSQYDALTSSTQVLPNPTAADAARRDGQLTQTLGLVGVGVGAAALAAAGALFLFGHDAGAPQPALSWTPGGFGIGIAGRLP